MKANSAAKRMLVLCPYPTDVAAGQRLKFEQYYPDWRAHGWTVDIAPLMDRRLWDILFVRGHVWAKASGVAKGYARRLRDLFRLRRYDLVYCFMYAVPLGGTGIERLVRAGSKRLVYDVEDNVMVSFAERANHHPNPLLRWLRGGAKYRYLIRSADHVIASSPALATECRRLNRHHAATYISSSLDSDRFVPAPRPAPDPLVIGWTGTFSSRPFLDELRPVFQELARQRQFRLRVVGNFDYDIPGVDVEVLRWSEEQEVEQLQGMDIGVYPLPLSDWVSGKSGLKAITYMMMGLPCVASDVGTTPLIIEDGVNGLLVRKPDEWLAVLEKLIDNSQLRRRLGDQARADAVERYSRTAIAGQYREILGSVTEANAA